MVRVSVDCNGTLGLFAGKDCKENEYVTSYGGDVTEEEIEGDYVLTVKSGRKMLSFDAERIGSWRYPQELGRFINESISRRNLVARFNSMLKRVEFYVKPGSYVRAGEEFFWFYGDDYRRNYDPK